MKTTLAQFCCLAALLAFVLFFTGAPGCEAATPMETMKGVVGDVFSTIQAYPVSGPADNLTKRRQKIREIIDQHFDSIEMSQRALGRYWKDISEEQRKEFTQLFYWRLYNFYILRVEKYSDEKVNYNKEIMKGDLAAVFTQVSSKKFPEFDIEYRLKKEGEAWKIYDVVIEGVSLVANYRSQFNSFLNKKSFDELLKNLREKNPQDSLQ